MELCWQCSSVSVCDLVCLTVYQPLLKNEFHIAGQSLAVIRLDLHYSLYLVQMAHCPSAVTNVLTVWKGGVSCTICYWESCEIVLLQSTVCNQIGARNGETTV